MDVDAQHADHVTSAAVARTYIWMVELFGRVVPPPKPLAALPLDTAQENVLPRNIAALVESVATPAATDRVAVVEVPAREESVKPEMVL